MRQGVGMAATWPCVIYTRVDVLTLIVWPASPLSCGHWSIALGMKRVAVVSAELPMDAWRRVSSFIPDEKRYET